MKTLVTGGTGFIGSHLITQLRRTGHDVRCVAKDKLNSVLLESLNVEIILGDLNNGMSWESILKDVDIIFHLAGVTRAKVMKDYYEGNTNATKRFAERCVQHCRNLNRFVYVSSLTAVGPRCNEKEVDEITPYHPISEYGKSKMLAELVLLELKNRLPLAIVRPSAVYGPRDRDMYEYFKIVKKGIEPLIGFKKKYLNLVHVEDLVEGIMLAGMHPSADNEIFFLGSEENYSTKEICDAIAVAEHKHAVHITLPESLVYSVGAIAGVYGKITNTQTLFNIQKAREATQTAWTCSVEKAKNLLGFCQHISLNEGMAKTYEWYKENKWL